MKKTFRFDLASLSLEEQKYLYEYLQAEADHPENIEKATNLEELKACFDEKNNNEVYRLAFMAALLAHEVAYLIKVPEEREGEKRVFVDLLLKKDIDLGEDFDIEWYDGLNSDGYGVISLVDTIDTYGLEELTPIFKKYSYLR